MFDFILEHEYKGARTGLLKTPHGTVETPGFIFCATKGALKCATVVMAEDAGTQIILANTYHLMINGGADLMKKAGGIHKFIGWNKPTLTDSGGFQIFSLGHGSVADEIKRRQNQSRKKSLIKITEDGAIFASHIDGQRYFLTPEKSMQVQNCIGSDFALVLDECTPFHVDKTYTMNSMLMSHAWEDRSYKEFQRLQNIDGNSRQALYGIIQGGVYEDLRRISADFVMERDFFGIAIGGSLGADKQQMYDVASYTCSLLSGNRPRHLLGIGIVSDIISLVTSGIDTFDCVHPTRIARHGIAIVKHSTGLVDNVDRGVNLRNSKFKEDMSPIDPNCRCYTCLNFSRSYIHYLIRVGEPLFLFLLTTHNIQQMNNLMADIRMGIREQNLENVARDWIG